jgi:hypothetical protein
MMILSMDINSLREKGKIDKLNQKQFFSPLGDQYQ